MAPRPTVIGHRVIGVDLPAFLLSKNFYSESIGMSRSGRVWWDLLARFARTRLPALLTPASAEFLLRVLVALRLALNSLAEIHHSSLATNHCCKTKNPASSAGYSHSHLSGSTRCSTSF